MGRGVGAVSVVLVATLSCGDNLSPPSPRDTPADAAIPFAPDAISVEETRGRVFLDRDGDGAFSAGDEPADDAVVFFETTVSTRTDGDGYYTLPVPPQRGIVWVRAEDTWQPGPHWAAVEAEKPIVVDDFAIPPQRATGPFSFVVGSDTHAGIELMSVDDQLLGLAQATARSETPYFITITGDLTQANQPEHFGWLGAAIDAIDVPFVPVPGNHDWYDGGGAYRAYFGPPSYSFDAGGYHFVVLNDAASLADRLAFVDRDLVLTEADRPVVVMMHAPPRTELREALESRDIDYLLTGHMHSNRVLLHDGFVEYNTQPLVMGGIDMTPGGYRIFADDGTGGLTVGHRNTVNEPIAAIVSPFPGEIAPPCEARLRVSIQAPEATVSVTATVETLGPIELGFAGGWVHASEPLGLCTDGSYDVAVNATLSDGTVMGLSSTIDVGEPPPTPAVPDWSMFQGDPAHTGQSSWAGAFPERGRWSGHVGGNIHGGSPIVHDSRVFVSVSDFGDGLAGGVVAFDAASGEKLWEHRVGFSVPHAPVASGTRVMFVSNDGTLHCVDAATGVGLWLYELAPGWPPVQRNLYSSPTISGNTVYAGGRHEFAALDIATGEVIWSVEPFTTFGDLGSHASPAVSDDVVVIPFNRSGGLFAYDAQLGTELWHTTQWITLGIQGSPVIDGDRVYVINELMQVFALDLMTGTVIWQRTVEPGAFGWGYLSSATPTLGDGQLYIATHRGALIALDANTGTPQWTYQSNESLIRATHYHGRTPALSAAPTSTPGLVWLPGTDGQLRVIDSSTGEPLWSLELQLPMTSSIVLAGDLAFVASFDGTVRALERAH